MFFHSFSDELTKVGSIARKSLLLRDKVREGSLLRAPETEEERKARELKLSQAIKTAAVPIPILDPVLGAVGDMGRAVDRKIEEHEHPINVLLGAALGGGLGIPVGAMAGGAIQSHRIGTQMIHPNAGAGTIRKILHAKRRLPPGPELARQMRKSINRGVLVGGGGGLALGALLGHQVAKALKRGREAQEMAKAAGPVKRQMTVDGLRMKLEYEKGDVRFKGAPHERIMKDHYGHIPGTSGMAEDGEAIDVYMNPVPTPPLGPVYRVKQLKKNTGELDESKYMVGYDSASQAKKAFLRNMPGWAFGSMVSQSLDSFKKKVGQVRGLK